MRGPEVAPPELSERIAANIALSRFRRRWDAERLEMYRRHLQIGVSTASPLVAGLEGSHGIDVAAQLWRLRPPFGWPEGYRLRDGGVGVTDCRIDVRGARGAWIHRAAAAITVRPADARAAPITLRISEGALELSTRVGEVAVRTGRGMAHLRLPFRLPDLVATAAVGQPVDALVGHPWFAGRGWRIREVFNRGGVDRIVVATGQLAFEMPWRRASLDGCGVGDVTWSGR